MDKDIFQTIENEIVDNPSLEEIKSILSQKGFSKKDADNALENYSDHFSSNSSLKMKRNIRLFSSKEVIDRVGYGFATHQFVNILFYITCQTAGLGAISYFIIGLFNSLKSLFSVVLSSFLQELSKLRQIPKNFMSAGGIIFGFSFLFMALAASKGLVWLFATSLLIGSIGVVSYGDLYNKLLKEHLRKERMGFFLSRISQYGIIITAISLILSGLLMDFIPISGKVFTFFGISFRVFGFLLSFEITAFAFIVSGYILSRIHQKKDNSLIKIVDFILEHSRNVHQHTKNIFSHKIMILLLLASFFTSISQILGNSFYGIFIYNNFSNSGFGGFTNVAVIFTFGIVISVFGPWLTSKLHKNIGFAPMLVFGTLLIAMMPFFSAWSPNLYSLGAANTLSIVGAAMVGVSQNLLTRKLLNEKERKHFFSAVSLIMVFPLIILVPLGSYLATIFGLQFLFKVISFVLLGLVAPLYIILVIFANKKKL